MPWATVDYVREAARPLLDGDVGDYDPLIKLMADARLVLLGTGSYGIHELFHGRAELTRRLIEDCGFSAIGLRIGAAAAKSIDSFVKGHTDGELASDALKDFTAFPRWLWRNAEMLDFLGWLRNFNDHFSGDTHKVGVHALELELPERTVVWGHSRNMGDARATADGGQSFGQQARDRFGRAAVLVHFTTFEGSMVSACAVDAVPQRVQLPPAPADTIEGLCDALAIPSFCLPIRGARERVLQALREPRRERMIDAVYGLEPLAAANFMQARLADQFDALVFFEETRSLEPF